MLISRVEACHLNGNAIRRTTPFAMSEVERCVITQPDFLQPVFPVRTNHDRIPGKLWIGQHECIAHNTGSQRLICHHGEIRQPQRTAQLLYAVKKSFRRFERATAMLGPLVMHEADTRHSA